MGYRMITKCHACMTSGDHACVQVGEHACLQTYEEEIFGEEKPIHKLYIQRKVEKRKRSEYMRNDIFD